MGVERITTPPEQEPNIPKTDQEKKEVSKSPEEIKKEFENGMDNLLAKYSKFFKKEKVRDASSGKENTFYSPLDTDMASLQYMENGTAMSTANPLVVADAWGKEIYRHPLFTPMTIKDVEKYSRAVQERSESWKDKRAMEQEK